MDVHYGPSARAIDEGTLVKVIGTSTCDCAVVRMDKTGGGHSRASAASCPGQSCPVTTAWRPGQSAVGDIFKWWVEGVCAGDAALHTTLTAEAAALRPGQGGLLALDWHNGNRTILVNPMLTGLILGQTLHTTRAEIYRALIEATAFGARAIIERLREYGVPVARVVCAGGIAEKNPLLMQIYADVTGLQDAGRWFQPGVRAGLAAVSAAVLARAYPDFASAQAAMTSLKPVSYLPIAENQRVYEELYSLYLQAARRLRRRE